ncbi:MAG: hypothetical protein ACREAA_11175 [Candidatus Polarisedimenticolia bacterium]
MVRQILLSLCLLAMLVACHTERVCDVCGRDECAGLAFRIEYADGGAQETCCPRCGSHALAEAGGRVPARLLARDFATGKPVDAHAARYVEGSDVEHCRTMNEQRRQELHYDRCLPSLIAFASEEQALSFVREHGGRLRTFEDLKFGQAPDAAAAR